MNRVLLTLNERSDELINATLTHIQISLLSLIIALVIAIPLGIYLSYHKKFAEFIIGLSGVMQTVPSLALLGLLIPFVGIGTTPAVIALVVYALLPILRNTYTGLNGVDPIYTLAARAMGMNWAKRLLKIQLPLAMPVIMAGVRTAMVLIIATATLAALIGAGGLGELILLGLDRNDNALILLGAIPAALLAIGFDYLLRKISVLKLKQILACFIGVIIVFGGLNLTLNHQSKGLVIAGKLGSEPEILINIYKILIHDEMPDLKIELKSGLGKTSFVFNALRSNDIDIYPEFSGTAVVSLLKQAPKSGGANAVYQQAKDGLKSEFDIITLGQMKYNNTYAIAVKKDFADKFGLKNISDLNHVQDKIIAGFTREFNDRDDGYKGLKDSYGFEFKKVVLLEPKLRYTALKNGEVNLIDAYATDSELQRYNLVVLKDDRNFFPPYQGFAMVKASTLEKYPKLETALNKLNGKISDEQMRKMNYDVAVNGKDAHDVALKFLQEIGLKK
ncbi:ABC transporter permease/substrate-binding protein [Campylobacter geochelonis]|uniref:ABC transporter permease/substrate-binding protein n=1 Tax=Campylobacter geochelonis TaxID=1780362 RepID=UPI0007706DC6|nr:ABC transporter permease/substrate-binding protein [Campylobacter geochelonis]CZE46147.1 Osmoprotectant-binding protein [Campylobacter geochelonis]